jgi:putative DNA-invertase from lambdoid prophage Rac
MNRVALYARVSTSDQSSKMQLHELREFARARKWTVQGEYVDNGISGTAESRPALDRMMLAARSRKIDGICVWKLDRYARSLKQIVNALSELKELGVAFVSIRDNLDFTTSAGRAMCNMIGVFAEFEHDLIVERTKAGMARAKAEGIRLGRPPACLNTERLRALRKDGLTITAIARRMKQSRTVVWRSLRSEGIQR